MQRLFGRAKEETHAPVPAPSLQEASAKIDLQVQALEAKISKCDADVKAYVAENKPTAKTRALQVMKRKKMYEAQRDKLIDTQFNVESMAHQQEAADITAITVAAMAAGQAKLQKQKESISIEKVERLTDDIAEVTEDLNDITDLLSKPLGMAAAEDEDEFAAEFERMQEEHAAEQMLDLRFSEAVSIDEAPVPTAPVSAPASSTALAA
mmetsp:Transcript_40379/g.107089  ORF Transcript_40379/g.107089 Transcript_40379/m.107089 type:complete len:209 (-) Transcript_40379:151-777(-)